MPEIHSDMDDEEKRELLKMLKDREKSKTRDEKTRGRSIHMERVWNAYYSFLHKTCIIPVAERKEKAEVEDVYGPLHESAMDDVAGNKAE